MYDLANSAFQTTIIAAVFPIYYNRVVAADLPPADATSRFAWATTIAILIVAVVAPLLGAIADFAAMKKKLLAVFVAIGASATVAMFWIERGDWQFALVLFVIGNVGVAGSIVFYESLLPHLVSDDQLDRVSSAGYAIGYLGGGVLLAINLLMIQKPELLGIPNTAVATRLTFVSVARVVDVVLDPSLQTGSGTAAAPRRRRAAGRCAAGHRLAAPGQTFRELRLYRQAFVMLLAFLLYNDGIQTMIRMATTYGSEIGLPESAMITALLMTQFIGVPCAFLFGALAERIGAKISVFAGLAVYVVITLLGYYMTTAAHFFALAILVGIVQGGTQALSRSMFASMIPRHKSSEFFAFFSVFERYAGVLGPAVFAWVVSHTGSGRSAILSVVVFFILGACILAFVNVEEGRRAARAAEAGLSPVAR